MNDGIAYQNKDILSKILMENFKDKSFEVFGLKLAPILTMLPTNLPALQLDEKRADNLFLLKDGSIVDIEYESTNNVENMIKYLTYVSRLLDRYYFEENRIVKIIIVVVYTGNIKKSPSKFNFGSVSICVEQVFLSRFNGDEVYEELDKKISENIALSDNDVMKFILLPLMNSIKFINRQELIEKSIELSKNVKNEKQQSFIISGILTASDKFIDKEYSKMIKEWLNMTKVAQLYEDEKREALNKLELEKNEALNKLESEKNQALNKLELEKNEALSKLELEKKEAIRTMIDMVIDSIETKYDKIDIKIIKAIKSINDLDYLKHTNKIVLKSSSLKEVEQFLEQLSNI